MRGKERESKKIRTKIWIKRKRKRKREKEREIQGERERERERVEMQSPTDMLQCVGQYRAPYPQVCNLSQFEDRLRTMLSTNAVDIPAQGSGGKPEKPGEVPAAAFLTLRIPLRSSTPPHRRRPEAGSTWERASAGKARKAVPLFMSKHLSVRFVER